MPEFKPSILSGNIQEGTYDEYIDIWEDRYETPQSLYGIEGIDFGIPNVEYGLGGGEKQFKRGNYNVRYQGPDGYFYSEASGRVFERLNRDFSVDWQKEVGQRMGSGNFSAFAVTREYIVTADALAAESENAELLLLDKSNGEKVFRRLIPFDVTGIAYDPERKYVYVATGANIVAVALEGTVNDEPQLDFEFNLFNDRNWLGEGYTQDVYFFDGGLYVYTKGRLYRLNKRTGRVIEFKDVLSEADADLETIIFTNAEDTHIDQHGNLHLLNRKGQTTPDEKNYYIVYDVDEEEVLKEIYIGNGVETLTPNVDDGQRGYEGYVNTFTDDGLLLEKSIWPSVLIEDKINSLGVTPWGYILGIVSDALPRYEMYDHATDTLQWTIHLGERGEDRGGTIAFNQAYPPLSHQPSKWKGDRPDVERYVNTPPDAPKLTTALSTGSFTEGTIVSTNSQDTTVTTTTNKSHSVTDAITGETTIVPQVGVIGGGEVIDGGAAAEETNTLYTETQTLLIAPDVSPLEGTIGGTWSATSENNVVTASVTTTSERGFKATVANSSDIFVAVDTVPNVRTTANVQEDNPPLRITARVLRENIDDYWRNRVVGVGETTDAGVSPE